MKHNHLLLGTLVVASALVVSCAGTTPTPTVTNTNAVEAMPESNANLNLNMNTAPAAIKTSSGATITLGKTSYKIGEPIVATYTASADLDTTAWIGLIPATTPHGSEPVNDEADLSYMYLRKTTSGKVDLVAPTVPGMYDLRLNESDEGGIELATSETFIVE